MPTYINNLCSAPYSLTGASGYKPLLTLEDIAAAIQELTALQNQLQCCTQTEKDAEVIVLTATPSGTAPNYDWSAEIRLNTCFFAGDVLTVDLTGIPNNFTLDSISPITPATVLINISAKTLVFTGTVLAGTYFVISGTFDDNTCAAGTATLTIAGDTVTSNNVAITTYSGANWCILKDILVDTDNNANGLGCNGGVLVYPFSIDLTARGGTKVAVTSDADIIAAYAALPSPIMVTISGCDIILPTGETPTNIEVECLYDCFTGGKNAIKLAFPAIVYNAGDVITVENIGYNALGSNAVFSYILTAANAAGINSGVVLNISSVNNSFTVNSLASLSNSIGASMNRLMISSTSIDLALPKISTVANPLNTNIRMQLLINGVVPAGATLNNTTVAKSASNQLAPCVAIPTLNAMPTTIAPSTSVDSSHIQPPNNNDGFCTGGFTSETLFIVGGGLNIPITDFPVTLCSLLKGLTVTAGTTSLILTSTVTTACGTATNNSAPFNITVVGGVITGVNSITCP